LLLSQQRVDVYELLLLLLMPLGCLLLPLGYILHMSGQRIFNLTSLNFQPSEVGVDVVQLPMSQSGLSWLDGWW
jgi:hypothetical protein